MAQLAELGTVERNLVYLNLFKIPFKLVAQLAELGTVERNHVYLNLF